MKIKEAKTTLESTTLASAQTVKQIFAAIVILNIAISAPEFMAVTKNSKFFENARAYMNAAVVVLSIFGFKPVNQVETERKKLGDIGTPVGQPGPNVGRPIYIPETDTEEEALRQAMVTTQKNFNISNVPLPELVRKEDDTSSVSVNPSVFKIFNRLKAK